MSKENLSEETLEQYQQMEQQLRKVNFLASLRKNFEFNTILPIDYELDLIDNGFSELRAELLKATNDYILPIIEMKFKEEEEKLTMQCALKATHKIKNNTF